MEVVRSLSSYYIYTLTSLSLNDVCYAMVAITY